MTKQEFLEYFANYSDNAVFETSIDFANYHQGLSVEVCFQKLSVYVFQVTETKDAKND